MWESSRLNSYLVAKANFKNINKINDIYPLPWDEGEDIKDNLKHGEIEITNEEIQRMEELEKIWGS